MGRTKQAAKKAKGKKGKAEAAPPPKPVEEESGSATSEEEDMEEDVPEVKVKAENGDEDSGSEEETPTPKKRKSAGKAKQPPAKKAKSDSEDGESDAENGDAESDGEEEADSGEEDADSEEEADSDEEKSKKRKAKADKKAAKKVKVEEDEEEDAEEKTTLFIANLPKDVNEKKLKKFFTKKDIAVGEYRKNAVRNFCYLDLEDAGDLDTALALSGEDFMGNTIKIEKAKPMAKKETQESKKKEWESKREGSDDKECTLFVKNLPFEVSVESIKSHFSGCVEVRMPTREDGSSKGFAFVQYSSVEDVQGAMDEKQGSDLDGNALFLDYVGKKSTFGQGGKSDRGGDRNQSSGERGKTKVLFVKNLSYDLTGEGLKDAFEGAKTARIASWPDSGKSRGFGFVEFDSAESAQEAFDNMKDAEIEGRQVRLDFASELGSPPRGDFRQGQWRGGRGGRGGDRGRGGRGFGRGRGDRGGGFRGGRGGRGRGGHDGMRRKDGIHEFKGSKKSFDD